jgi:5'/3'-nucleotidase SurE
MKPMPLVAVALFAAMCGATTPALALNILLTNDDGLTSNLKALYDALKTDGHDVVVSVPCSGQSGRGAGIVMYSTTTIVADNDAQITAESGCHNGAAPVGAPAVGPFLKPGYLDGDYNYVHGTPVMATMYGLDVLALARWGKAPDLVLSGPNEGQNVGKIVISSGTVSNAQFAASRGLSSIAVSAGSDTVDNAALANPYSAVVAGLTVKLIKELTAGSDRQGLLPQGLALNVNIPNAPTPALKFAFSHFGSFDAYNLKFKNTPPYGLDFAQNAQDAATPEQAEDESVVFRTKVAVTAMQVGFEQKLSGQLWLRLKLHHLFAH